VLHGISIYLHINGRILDLFNDAVGSSDYVRCMISLVNNELERIWMEAIVTQFIPDIG
jgi:hypothetical protein